MWIVPLIRAVFNIAGGLFMLTAAGFAFIMWQVPQPENARTGWITVGFLIFAGIALLAMARGMRKPPLPPADTGPQ